MPKLQVGTAYDNLLRADGFYQRVLSHYPPETPEIIHGDSYKTKKCKFDAVDLHDVFFPAGDWLQLKQFLS